jgi:hypothetical protein
MPEFLLRLVIMCVVVYAGYQEIRYCCMASHGDLLCSSLTQIVQEIWK